MFPRWSLMIYANGYQTELIFGNSESFRNIDQRLRTQLDSFDEIPSLWKLTITCYVGCLGSYGTSLSIIQRRKWH